MAFFEGENLDAGPGSSTLSVPPEHMREASNELHSIADMIETRVRSRLAGVRAEPAGLDAVSVMAAGWYNAQLHDGPGSGVYASQQAVANLRASAAAMARGAEQYEAQETAIAAGFRTDTQA